MKEYIVTKDILNIRNSATDENDDNFIGQLSVGETLYLTDDEIIGVKPKGGTTDIWKSDHLNRLVSLDGVRLKNYADRKAEFIADSYNQKFIDPAHPDDESKWKVNWGIVDLEVWKLWKQGFTGKGVTVAVIDSGVNAQQVANSSSLNSKLSCNIFNNTNNVDDAIGHGTNVAGLIISNGGNGIYGIAPEVNLIMIQAIWGQAYYADDVATALEHLKDIHVDLISLSLELPQSSPRLDLAISSCLNAGKLIVASCGNPRQGENVDPVSPYRNVYPASSTGVISIGAYLLDDTNNRAYYSAGSVKSDTIKMVLPGHHLLDIGTVAEPNFFDKTSAATAFGCGAIALVLSGIKKQNWPDAKKLIDLLPNICEPIISTNANWNINEGFGVFNPELMNDSLKSQTNIT